MAKSSKIYAIDGAGYAAGSLPVRATPKIGKEMLNYGKGKKSKSSKRK